MKKHNYCLQANQLFGHNLNILQSHWERKVLCVGILLTLFNQGGLGWTAPSTAPVEPGVQAVTSSVCVAMEEHVTRWMVTVPALQAGEERGVNSTAR